MIHLTPEAFLYILLAIVVFDFIIEQVLDYLNLSTDNQSIPPSVKEYYDNDKYRQTINYQRTRTRFSFVTSSLSFVASVAILYFGGFGWLDQLVRSFVNNPILLALIYFGVLAILSDLLTLPFQLYHTFVIEERFGFNKTTLTTFIADKIKGYLLGILFGGSIMAALIYLILSMGNDFWIYFLAVVVVYMLLANMFYSSLILPLFNKLTPLEEGSLKVAIESYSRKVGFPLDNIYVIDGSKRSNKANAFFTGLGKKKKIVLYDTLINNNAEDELVAILAHEVGHFKKKHILFGFLIAIIQVGIMLFIMSTIIFNENLSLALGADVMGIHLNLIAFGLLYSPISKITGIVSNIISRKNEFEADAYAAETYNAQALSNALKKLSVDNLSYLYPHPAYVFVHHSHPPLLQRLGALGELK